MLDRLSTKFAIVEPGEILTSFQRFHDTLGPDVYHPAEIGGRSRRLAQHYATFDPGSGKAKITRLLTQPFLQGKYNKLTGHIQRPIEPALPETDFKPYIRYGFKEIQSRWPLEGHEGEWLVNCHLIRTHAYEGQNGHPAPEGSHRDGVEFVIMGCVQKQNIVGGVSHLYEGDNSTPIHGVTLEPGQALLVDDRELFHMVSPVLATAKEGFRDMILMGFHYWSRGHYRADWRESIYDLDNVEHEL